MLLSNADPWLSDDQLARLTKKKHIKAQVSVLVAAGIPFAMVAGRPVVVESSLQPMQQSQPRPQVKKLA